MTAKRIFWQIYSAHLAIPLIAALVCLAAFHRAPDRQEVERGLFWGALAAMALAASLSFLMARRISRPLEQIRRGAERFAAGDFTDRLPAVGSAEIRALAETLNALATQLEERLRTLTEEIGQRKAILSSMVEGALVVDAAGRIVSLNTAAANYFKVFRPETAPGRTLEEVFRNVRLQRFVAEVMEGREPREREIEVEHGRSFILQARGTHLADARGRRGGAVVVFNDIFYLRRLENLRRDFVANVSHELKTPITAIKGFVETLLDGAMSRPQDAESFLKIILKHTDRLDGIIRDLLALSRMEKDEANSVERMECALRGILESAVEICAQRAAAKRIAVRLECPGDLSAAVNSALIEQALINLIHNAIQYSGEDKTVVVCAEKTDEGTRLSVRDQGHGIEEKHLPRLFERFYRVDKGRSRQEGGTGLGLSIVKHIAEVHGGSVSVQSRFGEGSVFSLWIR